MATRYSRARTYEEKGLKMVLEQFLDKRRAPVARDIIVYLYHPHNQPGVRLGRIYEALKERHEYPKPRLCRVLKDLLKVGLIKDVGSSRTTRIYTPSFSYCASSLRELTNKLERIDKGLRNITPRQWEKEYGEI